MTYARPKRFGTFLCLLLGAVAMFYGCSSDSGSDGGGGQVTVAGVGTAPEGLRAEAISPSRIRLAWQETYNTDNEPAAGYVVIRDQEQVAELGREVSYTDGDLVQDTRYCYQVAAMDTLGRRGPATDEVCATPWHAVHLTRCAVATEAPSVVSLAFVADDQDGLAVTDLVLDDLTARQDGDEVDPALTYPELLRRDRLDINVQVVLALDLSGGPCCDAQTLAATQQTAHSLVGHLLAGGGPVQVALMTYDDQVTQVIGYSSNAAELDAAIDSLAIGALATDLYGAAFQGLGLWRESFSASSVQRGYLVLVNRNPDSAGIRTAGEVLAARGGRQVLAVALGSDADPDALSLVANAGVSPVAYSELTGVDADQVEQAAAAISDRILSFPQRFYLVQFASLSRAGTHSASVGLVHNTNQGLDSTISGSFSAEGFSQVLPELVLYGSGRLETGDAVTWQAASRWVCQLPLYTWESDAPGTVGLTISNGSEDAALTALTAGQAVITVTDTVNQLSRRRPVGVGITPLAELGGFARDPRNPVLAPAGTGWDSAGVRDPWVIRDEGIYKMWYCGTAGTGWQVGYAVSDDGIVWTRPLAGPVLAPADAGAASVYAPSVLLHDGVYHMWFTRWNPAGSDIGQATSVDGISWTVQALPALTPDGDGWNADHLAAPAVHHDGLQFRMDLAGCSENLWFLGQAVSDDGLVWQVAPDPLLPEAGQPGWQLGVAPRMAVADDGISLMRLRPAGQYWRTAIAADTAVSGEQPQEKATALEAGAEGAWDAYAVESPALVVEDSRVILYYTGRTGMLEGWQIGRAVAAR